MVYEIILHALSIITGEGKGEGRTKKEEKGRSDRIAESLSFQGNSDDFRTHLQSLISDRKDHTPLSQAGLCSLLRTQNPRL